MAASDCMGWVTEAVNQNQVKYFMQKAAIAVMSEDASTANHINRFAFAQKVLTGSASIFEFTVAVTTNSTVAAHIAASEPVTDSDVEFVVNSMFNAFAG